MGKLINITLYRNITLANIFISPAFKVKITDYCLTNINSDLPFEDGLILDLFNIGICLLKILGLVRIEENINFYDHDKRKLRNYYKHVRFIF
jgi:hypothetical protein